MKLEMEMENKQISKKERRKLKKRNAHGEDIEVSNI